MKAGSKEVRMMYLESIFNLSQLEDTAPELVRHGLVDTLSELYSLSPDKDVARTAAKIMDKLVIQNNMTVHIV